MNPTGSLMLSRESLALSDSVTAILRIEAASPFTVSVPAEVLASSSADVWRIRATGNATVETTANGLTVWTQSYQLDPYVPGAEVPVAFAPVKVKTGADREFTLEIPSKMVKVETSIRNPRESEARPITGWEDPPFPPPEPTSRVAFVMVGLASVVILATAILFRQRRPTARVPRLSFADRLAALESFTGREFAERLNTQVREWLRDRHAADTERMTSQQLLALAPSNELKDLLGWCDEVKFAGRQPSADECRGMLANTRRMMDIMS